MSRSQTALAYVTDEADRLVIEAVIPQYRVSTEVRKGGLAGALEDAPSWTVAPDFLILDSSDVSDPVAAVQELARRSPPGETDVILVGAQNDVTLYRALTQIGVSDYLLKPIDGGELGLMIERLLGRRRDVMGSIDPQRIIAVTGTRGGVGASTVATAMANAISERHFRRALLVDLDLHGGTQYLAFNTDPTPGLFEILQSPQRVDALFFERTVTRVSSRLALLSADETDAEVEATDEGLDALLSQARQGIDAVVLDIPRRAAVGQRALRSAGTVVIVTALTLPCLRETIKLIENVERKGTVNQILVAVNRVGEHRAGVMTAKDFSKQIRRDVITLPFDPRAVTQALAQAKPLIDFRRPISDSLIKLASHLPTAPQHSASFFDKLWGR